LHSDLGPFRLRADFNGHCSVSRKVAKTSICQIASNISGQRGGITNLALKTKQIRSKPSILMQQTGLLFVQATTWRLRLMSWCRE